MGKILNNKLHVGLFYLSTILLLFVLFSATVEGSENPYNGAVVIERPDGTKPYLEDRVKISFKEFNYEIYEIMPGLSEFPGIPFKEFLWIGNLDIYNNQPNGKNMGVIFLSQSGKQVVVDAINTLASNRLIYSVEPIYYEEPKEAEGELPITTGADFIEYAFIENSYYDNRIFVVIDANSDKNEYELSDFEGIGVEKIEEVSVDNYKAISDIDQSRCKKILMLHLVESGKESINAAIELISENDWVYAVNPVYTEEYEPAVEKIWDHVKDIITENGDQDTSDDNSDGGNDKEDSSDSDGKEDSSDGDNNNDSDVNDPNIDNEGIDLSKVDGNETYIIGNAHYIDGTRYLIGDVSADKRITARDALLILKHVASLEKIEELKYKLADVDLDENITAKDALVVLKYSADCFDGEDINLEYNDCIKTKSDKTFFESDFMVISSFDEYTAYMQDVVFRSLSTQKTLKALLDAEYFENNSLLVIKDYQSSGSIKVNFINVENEDGKYVVKFSKYYPSVQYADLAFYEYYIPIEGKDISADNVVIEIEELK